MSHGLLDKVLCSPPTARPAILEGRWLRDAEGPAWAAANPVGVLEGGPEAFEDFPAWVAWHAQKYPSGAAIGFLSYELGRVFERVQLPKLENLPDLSFAYYPDVKMLSPADTTPPVPNAAPVAEFRANFDKHSYHAAVAKIREYIAAGDIYQANLTVQFLVGLGEQRPQEVYRRLRCGRAPFRAFLSSPNRTILGASPERFVRVSGNRILASPIKGTIGRSIYGHQEARQKLLSSSKDRAENVMIVDLLRNDLGRICRYDSIRVRLWETETLPHLVHLVSHVEGTLRSGTGLGDIFRALFPCGSITGAPKIRAMEVLSEIERVPRGASMGAVGIIRGVPGSDRCTMDFNVAIRTILVQGHVAKFNVGGGIVYDSQAATEYEEVMLKAQPLLQALGATNPAKILIPREGHSN
jgi:para-aminobenzoate synthetase component 1